MACFGFALAALFACDVNDSKGEKPKATDTAAAVSQPTVSDTAGSNARLLASEEFIRDINDTIVGGGSDWYRLRLSKDSAYAIITGYKKNISRVTIYSSSSGKVLAISDSGKGYVTYKAAADGVVRVKFDGIDSKQPYNYSFMVLPLDGYEPNDVMSEATMLPTDSTIFRMQWFAMGPWGARDVDWVKMRTEIGKVYELFDFTSDTLMLMDGAGGKVPFASGSRMIGFTATDTITYAKVLIQISRYGATYNTVPRSVAAVRAPNDRFEPDGSFAGAREIPVDNSVQEHLISIGDVDVAKFRTAKGKLYRVTMNAPKYGLDFDVLGADTGNTLSSGGSAPRCSKTVRATQDGFHYIRFRSSSYRLAYSVAVEELPADADESEGLGQAASLSAGEVNFRYLDPSEEDWFRFSADSGRTYVLSHPYREPNTLAGSLWSIDSSPVPTSQVEMMADSGGGIFYCTKSGTYGYRLTGSGTGGYSTKLEVKNSSPAWYDALEPDDAMRTAGTLVPDSSVSRHRLHVGDTDWVKIELDSGSTYVVDAKGTCRMALYSSDSVDLGADRGFLAGANGFATISPKEKTSIFVELMGFALPSDCELRSWPLAGGGIAAKGISTAEEIPLDNLPRSFVLHGKDNWVKVHLENLIDGRLYDFSLGNLGASASLSLGVFRADSTQLNSGRELIVKPGATYGQSFTGYPSGDYYLNVARYDSQDTGAIPFTLAAKADAVDSFEIDNSAELAKPILVGDPPQQRILNWKDQDWFAIRADSGVEYRITAQILDDIFFLNKTLYDPDLVEIGSNSSERDWFGFTSKKSGTYYLKVQSQSSYTYPCHYAMKVVAVPPLFPPE